MRRYRSFVMDSARWEGFAFRDGDIVISTPPKCGTTWTQMICALLIYGTPDLPAPLAVLSPWLDMQLADRAEVFARLEAQTERRFIKTHTPYDGLPHDPRVTYLCVGRDPRDVAMSWDHHLANMDMATFVQRRAEAVGLDDLAELGAAAVPPPPLESPEERFWQWVDTDDDPTDQVSSLRAALHHFTTFWSVREQPNIVLLHYSDLKRDLPAQMESLAKRLGIERSSAAIGELAEAAEFSRMKERAEELAPNSTDKIWVDTTQFFNKGANGQWREILATPEDLARYDARVSQLAEADVAEWAHRGWG